MDIKNFDTSLQSYGYNSSSGKLSLTDGSEDEFCRFFNNELSNSDSVTKADAQKKSDINNAIENLKYNTDKLNSGDILNLEFQSFDAFRSSVKIGGYTMNINCCLSDPNEFESEENGVDADYSYSKDITYSKQQNGISLVPGKSIEVNGKVFTIEENYISIKDSNGNDIRSSEAGYDLSDIMNIFIRYANDQKTVNDLYTKNMNKDILSFLNELGIDTSKNFIVNEREFKVSEDKIVATDEADNQLAYLGLTKRQLEAAKRKYQDNLLGTYESGR